MKEFFSRRTERNYDINLLLELNKEYESRRTVPAPRVYNEAANREYALSRVGFVSKQVDLSQKKSILEIGCGTGEVARGFVDSFENVTMLATEVLDHSSKWNPLATDRLVFAQLDVTKPESVQKVIELNGGRKFDLIVSYVVLEHVLHPYTLLKNCSKALNVGGEMYLRAQLYRGTDASHLYRDLFFPWPHLLFSDDVIEEFYRRQGKTGRVTWVNKLTYAQYLLYFRQLHLAVTHEVIDKKPLDEGFYERFEDVLGAYPIFDLESNIFNVFLRKEQEVVEPFQIKRVLCSVDSNGATAGAPITWTCVADGGGVLEYAWYVYNGDTQVDTIWYERKNTLTWTPKEPGQYKVLAYAKNESNEKLCRYSAVVQVR